MGHGSVFNKAEAQGGQAQFSEMVGDSAYQAEGGGSNPNLFSVFFPPARFAAPASDRSC
jgi:hypothetical protein